MNDEALAVIGTPAESGAIVLLELLVMSKENFPLCMLSSTHVVNAL